MEVFKAGIEKVSLKFKQRNATRYQETEIMAKGKTKEPLPEFLSGVRNMLVEDVYKDKSKYFTYKMNVVYDPGLNESAVKRKQFYSGAKEDGGGSGDVDFMNNPKYIFVTNLTNAMYINKSHVYSVKNNNSLLQYYQLDIDDHLFVMGEVVSESYNTMKAYTKLEVKLDVFEVYGEARKRIEEKMQRMRG